MRTRLVFVGVSTCILSAISCGGSEPAASAEADAGAPSASRDASAPDTPSTNPKIPTTEADAGQDAALGADTRPACNGAPSLCEKRFDEVVYATTHNSMSNAEDSWVAPNQAKTMRHQLEAGARAMMLDTYSYLGGSYLCHGYCAIGSRLLADGLRDIGAFLDTHPREIVSIIFESYLPAAATREAFVSAGLEPYLHAQPKDKPWPKLSEMITSGKRLVVFTDAGGGTYPWYHAVWDYAWETPYAYKTKEEMKCVVNRGNGQNGLFIFNHFLTNPVASEALARQVNFNPFLGARASECQTTFKRLPNFVTVDFVETGDVMPVVKKLNGL